MKARLWAFAVFTGIVVSAIALVAVLGAGSAPRAGTERAAVQERTGEPDRDAGEGPDRRARIETDPDRGHENGGRSPISEQFENRAYPRDYIAAARVKAAMRDFRALPTRLGKGDFRRGVSDTASRGATPGDWRFLGPDVPFAPGPTTESLRDSITSGRITSLAVDPGCDPGGTGAGPCTVYVASASGGVWRTDDALAATPTWKPLDNGLPTGAVGFLLIDPRDPSVLYAGTGEANQINQSGLGIYQTSDRGASWTLVPGSDQIAHDRSIGSMKIDADGNLWVGTALGRLGQSSANGGQSEPPGAPTLGLWEKPAGGDGFQLALALPGDVVPDPTLPGRRFAAGGVNDIEVDAANPGTVYAAVFGYGVFRTTDGGTTWAHVFTPVDEDPGDQRTEMALTHTGGKTRLYLADGGSDANGDPTGSFWRTDDAAALPDDNTANAGWTRSTALETQALCQAQCTYDLFVEVDPTNPDTVWFGGSMVYEEIRPLQDQSLIGVASNRSNGRAVMRSTDAGATFTDMTADTRDRSGDAHYEQMHPDQHALVFDPHDTGIAFVGSDGGIVRTDGQYDDISDECATRDGVASSATDLALCRRWLSAVPHRIENLNAGLATLQFVAVNVDPRDPYGELLGGTQDNGTFALAPLTTPAPQWFESVNGDGGQAAFDVGRPNVRFHTYFLGAGDTNFHGPDPNWWVFSTQPITDSGEGVSFYTPVEGDPVVPGTIFIGAGHVWRTKDDGGDQAQLEANCRAPGGVPEYTGNITCGDFVKLGDPSNAGSLVDGSAADRGGSYTVEVERAPSDRGTLWVGTRRGRIYVSSNADADDPAAVRFTRIDDPSTPGRFPSGIAIDPADPNHAYVSYSGYSAYTPQQPGHVFDVHYDPATGKASFTDISGDLPDTPITDVALDEATGDLYASTDYGALRRPAGATSWQRLTGLPNVNIAGLTPIARARVIYAATYGRSVWALALPPVARISGPDTVKAGRQATYSAAGSAGYKQTSYSWSGAVSGSGATARFKATGAPGPRTITLTVADDRGKTTTVTKTITVTAAHGSALRDARLSRARIRVTRGRTAAVLLRCPATVRSRCRGQLLVVSGHRVLWRRSFSTRADRMSGVRVKLSPTAYKTLVARKRLRVTITLTTRGADGVLRQKSAQVTLLPPHRRR